MKINLESEIAALSRLTVKRLRAKYVEVFGEATLAANKAWLVKRIAWRLQWTSPGMVDTEIRV